MPLRNLTIIAHGHHYVKCLSRSDILALALLRLIGGRFSNRETLPPASHYVKYSALGGLAFPPWWLVEMNSLSNRTILSADKHYVK